MKKMKKNEKNYDLKKHILVIINRGIKLFRAGFLKKFLIFFTKGKPEQIRNCVIQPLK